MDSRTSEEFQAKLNVSTNGDTDTRTNTNGNGVHEDKDAWKEVSLEVPWGIVAGKWWGPQNRQPVLAFHGWQDNAGTFDRLCPLLPAHIPIFCIDLPGHGKSTHYPKGMLYFIFWDGIALIRRIVRRYGWEKVALMGHSLGGCLTFMYAACYPDEVSKLINIDVAGPPVPDLDETSQKTGWGIDKCLDYEKLTLNKMPCYDYDEMVKIAEGGYSGAVDEESAKVLMRRGMAPLPAEIKKDAFNFARDIRLKIGLLIGWCTAEQVIAYAKRIRCKVLNIRAEPFVKIHNRKVYDDVIETLRENAELVIFEKVSGTHHLHLVTPERVAPIISKWWGPQNRQPVLAFHGWQDNAGTFDRLCPLLPAHIPILSLDLPGHGKSSHYPKGMQYFEFWDGIAVIRRIVRRYGWEKITLMGHSLGGAIAFMYTACYPDEVSKLINIDVAGPVIRDVDRTAEKNGWAIDRCLDYETMPENKMPCYKYEDMVKLFVDSYNHSLDEESAKILMRRGVKPVPAEIQKDSYTFTRDNCLKMSLLAMPTAPQVMAYAKRIRCKVLNIRATPGVTYPSPNAYDEVIEILKKNADLTYEKVPGTHHLHLVTPERVAPIISKFLLKS